MEVSQLLRLTRERAGFTQSLLARLSGVAQPKVSAYESGRESPTTKTLAKLLDACGAELRSTGRRIPAQEMGRGARRSLEHHRRIAADLLTDKASRRQRLGQARETLAEARVANPFGELWHEWWNDLLNGPLDELISTLVGEDSHSIELRANSPFVGARSGERHQEVGGAAR
jgi:transcriptional regulator with XRE-family HTH domain